MHRILVKTLPTKLPKLDLKSVRMLATVKDIFPNKSEFPTRHIGPRKTDVVSMLNLLGFKVWDVNKYSDKIHQISKKN